jgi:hypothetical protein
MKTLKAIASRFPARRIPALRAVLSLAAGLLSALVFSYLLYRIGLPGKPFIYVSF